MHGHVHTHTHTHLIQTSQHKSNLPTTERGNNGEGVGHDGEERATCCHHLLNERKITPMALPCNHGDTVHGVSHIDTKTSGQ